VHPGLGAAVVAFAYLAGSVPVAVLVGRAHGVDPRAAGDHNAGYWNVKQLVGRRAAAPVFVGDALKGAVGAAAGTVVGHLAGCDRHEVLVLTWIGAAAAMVGHAWPVFARFQGGRSILTYAGGLAVLSPRTVGLSLAALLLVWAVRRSFTEAARVGVFGSALASLVVDGPWRTAAVGVLQSLIGLRFAQAAVAARRHRCGGRCGRARCGRGGGWPR
jgi:glycerol-3-phosphate acyltransferase PlsY